MPHMVCVCPDHYLPFVNTWYGLIVTGNWVSELEREAIILEAGEERKAVALSIINDNEIEATECVCLEVVSCYKDPMDTSPPVTSTVCIEDDDSE